MGDGGIAVGHDLPPFFGPVIRGLLLGFEALPASPRGLCDCQRAVRC